MRDPERARPVPARLILYLQPGSPACGGVRELVERVLRRFRPGSFVLETRDPRREFERTTRDRSILIVPTLCLAGPRDAYLVGDLAPDRVVAFLLVAGLELVVAEEGS